MKRVKVKPDFFPFFEGKATYADGSDIIIESMENKENDLSNELIMILKDENDKQKILKFNGLDFNGLKFLSSVPNPLFLLLNSSIDSYNKSEKLLHQFLNYSGQVGNKTFLLNLNEEYTSNIYNEFITNKIVSINSLINSIEIFINQKIPKDYVHIRNVKGKEIRMNKTKIENSLSFREKIDEMLPNIFSDINFQNLNEEVNLINSGYSIRKATIHMKTGSDSPFEQYYEVMKEILNISIEPIINSAITLINTIHPNLIEFD